MEKNKMDRYDEPFWDKTFRIIREMWTQEEQEELNHKLDPDLSDEDLTLLRGKIEGCLTGKGGEVSARSRAAEVGRAYLMLSEKGKKKFLKLLVADFGINHDQVKIAINKYQEISDPSDLQKQAYELRNLLEPSRTKLLRQFNELQEGVKFLVKLRAEILRWVKTETYLKALNIDVYRLLVSWFDIGFLDLRRITWNTPAAILEKLIEYEAVHAISSLKDLKNRLRDDRRCYAYFHPRMKDEPLIFVQVALVKGISKNVLNLLDIESTVGNPEEADTAIFYSISNCQAGLAGVSFGNFLIKRVVADLVEKHPNLKTFSTLSPIPKFMKWANSESVSIDLSDEERDAINITNKAAQDEQLELPENIKEILIKLCARYLLTAKRGDQAYDRVSHFHLSNGALIERINWGGDLTPAGMSQSAGIMVNYLYDLSSIEKNHELYTGHGEIIASEQVLNLNS